MAAGLEVESTRRGDALIVRVRGDAGMANVDVLDEALTKACAEKPLVAVLDMSQMSFISSIGMGSLVAFKRGIERCGGKMKVAALQPMVADAFKRARLTDVFEIHDTVESAIGEAGSAPKAKPAKTSER